MNPFEKMEKRIHAAAPSVEFRRDIAKKAMSPERDDRYETAAQMQAALEAYIEAASMRVVDEDVGGFIVGLFAEQRSQVRKLVPDFNLSARMAVSLAGSVSCIRATRGSSSPNDNVAAASSPRT